MLRSLRTDTVARNGGCLNVGSKARSGPSGGERKAGEGWAGQNPTLGWRARVGQRAKIQGSSR